jgi:hypothetical protein
VALRIEKLHLSQPVLRHQALDQLLRPRSAGKEKVDEPRVVQQALCHRLFHERVTGDGVPAARLQDIDQCHRPILEFTAQVPLEAARLHQGVRAQQDDQ